MSGIMVPDSGYCEIMGQVPWKHRIRHVRQIGVVFGQRSQLWWDVPVADSFDLLKDIYKIPQSTFNVVRDELVSGLGLENLLNIPVRQLSLGQKMRCELAASLLHQPALLFLDEPTIGLDAISKLAVRDFIRKINRDRGVTVILTTHDMDDIEALCSRVMLIGKGRILLDGTINQMRSTVMPERILKIEFASCPQDLSFTDLYLKHFEGNQAEFRFNPQKITAAELVHRISQKQNIKDFTVENPPIEEIVARMYGNLKI
jgi:ABC-2 type transport system ATP-binding protein